MTKVIVIEGAAVDDLQMFDGGSKSYANFKGGGGGEDMHNYSETFFLSSLNIDILRIHMNEFFPPQSASGFSTKSNNYSDVKYMNGKYLLFSRTKIAVLFDTIGAQAAKRR